MGSQSETKHIFFIISVLTSLKHCQLLTHSQFLEGLKCESQIENNGRVRSRGTLFGSQHFGEVEGHAGALGWD
jgi:hypothetical protein